MRVKAGAKGKKLPQARFRGRKKLWERQAEGLKNIWERQV